MPSRLEAKIQQLLDSRKSRSILRQVAEPVISSHSPSNLIDFSSNDYLSLSTNNQLRELFLQKLADEKDILGSGGSRLLDGNTPGHFTLETRLKDFFKAPAALLFNSGFDANSGLFSCLPQPGDYIVFDEYIHASVWDGCRASRAAKSIHVFKHNSVYALEKLLCLIKDKDDGVRRGDQNIFISVESLYSMDGDFAPLPAIVDVIEKILPKGNGHLIVDEAHATGVYGPQGRGLVAMYGLDDKVTARLHTFGKALATNGAVVITSPLIRAYLCNYARPLIFSTAMTCSNVVSINCSFDMLQNGAAEILAGQLMAVAQRFLDNVRPHLRNIRRDILSLPDSLLRPDQAINLSPIVPALTSKPRPLAAHLQTLGFLVRPITYPTVPKGQDRVRICLHAANNFGEVDGLSKALVEWAYENQKEGSGLGPEVQTEAKL